MEQKTCVLTGASNGIGRTAALALAKLGQRMVLVCRDQGRGQAVVDEIRAAGGTAELVLADLSSMAEVRAAAARILELCPRIDVLLNNAGAMFNSRKTTADGYEMTFALNHLAYFLLTELLLERIKKSAPARIINVSSMAHEKSSELPFDDIHMERGYSGFARYRQSKLANVLHARELSRRLEGTGVTANSLHPGVVATNFGQNEPGLFGLLIKLAHPFFFISPEEGAKTMVYLASSPDVAKTTGKYFDKCAEKTAAPRGQDDQAARRLWEISEKLTGIKA